MNIEINEQEQQYLTNMLSEFLSDYAEVLATECDNIDEAGERYKQCLEAVLLAKLDPTKAEQVRDDVLGKVEDELLGGGS